ncbi:hypothetical protein E4U13_003424 [Claviceps humidiphila]|uniref:Uncharacterized protein n=1 Tax=Claviceps humidiphila TaxID=1294629 RepID=A0A9P7TWJ2_9HYPO|nr:hypothetical protein E4U13_003424 [Claviceps humidiphila]
MADMAMDDCDEPIGNHHRTRTNDSHHHQPGSELEANAAAATVHVQPTAPPMRQQAPVATRQRVNGAYLYKVSVVHLRILAAGIPDKFGA